VGRGAQDTTLVRDPNRVAESNKAAVCVGAARPTNQIDHVCSAPTEGDVPVIRQAPRWDEACP
jgi:hypothetical protein